MDVTRLTCFTGENLKVFQRHTIQWFTVTDDRMCYRGGSLYKILCKGLQSIGSSAGNDLDLPEAVPDPAFQAVLPCQTVDERTKPDTLYDT
jgi:hypothetical protein